MTRKAPPAVELPPIHSADHKILMVGMTVFGVDTNCNKDRIPKLEVLKIIHVDLGSQRMIRLLRSNGTEWVWSAQERRSSCRTSEQLIFANRKSAAKIARKFAEKFLAKMIHGDKKEGFKPLLPLSELIIDKKKSQRREMENKKQAHANELDKIRREHSKRINEINAFKKKIAAIK